MLPKSCKREYNAMQRLLNAEFDGPGGNF